METDSNIHGQLVFKNVAKRRFNRERIVFATGGAGIFLYTYAKKKKKNKVATHTSKLIQNLTQNLIKDLIINYKTIELLEKNIEE